MTPRSLGWVVAALALVGGLTWTVTTWIGRPWTVAGDSMAPTLVDGDRVLVDLRAYRDRPPSAGEIVLIEIPGSGTLIKRVGDRPPLPDERPATIWVLGDNREASLDSRRLGPLPVEAVIGRVRYRYWPPGRAGRLR